MRIQYFSDVHLECFKKPRISLLKSIIHVKAATLVMCGDIGYPETPLYEDFLSHLSSRFTKIFLLSGNHEYYNKSIEKTNTIISNICKKYDNITFLNNSYEDHNGYRFVGTTLWSNITDPNYLVNDFKRINDMSINSYNQMHRESRHYIESTLESSPHPIVMLTHHLPSHNIVDQEYKQHAAYQQCFSSELDHLIRFPIKCWIYGHTHRPCVTSINGVSMYCNPIGYPGENIACSFNKVIDM